MSYSGEQTLLVTRPTRLIALRWWSAVVLALIVAGAPFLQLPWRVSSPPCEPGLGTLSGRALPPPLFLFLPPLPLLLPPPKRQTTPYVITANKINCEDRIP